MFLIFRLDLYIFSVTRRGSISLSYQVNDEGGPDRGQLPVASRLRVTYLKGAGMSLPF